MRRLWALYQVMGAIAYLQHIRRVLLQDNSAAMDWVHYWATGQYFRIWGELGRPNLMGMF